MKPQAVRRSPRYFALRAWWRQLDLATQADAVFGAVVLLGWLFLGIALQVLE